MPVVENRNDSEWPTMVLSIRIRRGSLFESLAFLSVGAGCCVFGWGLVAECGVLACCVVLVLPFTNDVTCVGKGIKTVDIQAFVPYPRVERFHIAVASGLARRNICQTGVFPGPFFHDFRDELRAVVRAQHGGVNPASRGGRIQVLTQHRGGYRTLHHATNTLTRELIHDRHDFQRLPGLVSIKLEIHSPHRVRHTVFGPSAFTCGAVEVPRYFRRRRTGTFKHNLPPPSLSFLPKPARAWMFGLTGCASTRLTSRYRLDHP